MPGFTLDPPLMARSGGRLQVLGIARISTPHQDAMSLDDQAQLYREWLERHAGLPYDLTMIASRGSGECLDRAELVEAEQAVESRRFDLVIAEDLGRIMRRIHAVLFCEVAEDAGTRVIAINDSVDTAKENWRMFGMFATTRHEMYNADTGKRIRRTQRNRFREGGSLSIPLFCYEKPPGAKHDSQLRKITELEPIVEEVFRRLEDRQTYSGVADWLNEKQVRLGPGCRSQKWTGAMVRRIVFNPIFKGTRRHNERVAKRINRTGRRKCVAAPTEELLTRECPHLAFIEPARYDRIVERLKAQGERYSVPKRRGNDPRVGRPKKRTRFPGQQVYCGICGRAFVFGGNGQKEHMMCSGARTYQCWNGATLDADLAATKLSAAVFGWMATIPDFDPMLVSALEAEALHVLSDRDSRRAHMERETKRIDREISNLLAAVRAGVIAPSLQDDLQRLEADRSVWLARTAELGHEPVPQLELPPISTICEQALEEFKGLSLSSPEFGRVMRKTIPRIVVFPVQLLDGDKVTLRAQLTVSLNEFLPAGSRLRSVQNHVQGEMTVDLFDYPQRAEFREKVVALRAQGHSEREVARLLDLTLTATQHAAALQRLMDQQGATDPYRQLYAPLTNSGKMRRHLHPRFRFEPLPPSDAA